MNCDGTYRWKRLLDLVLVAIFAAPAALIGAICALAIKLDDRGPVLFRQERVGLGGTRFVILKFRTMPYDSTNSVFPTIACLTRSGGLLRRLSLDELPQLLNVAKGDMSIVGPRPTLAYQVDRYTGEQRRRLAVRPGLTGLAQVSGRNSLIWADRISLDLEYLDKQSAVYDLYLLLRSIRIVLAGNVGGHPVTDPIALPEEARTPQ